MSYTVHSATKGPSHHFFGFHDLVQWNTKGNLMLGLEVEDISHPPMPGEIARSGIIIPDTQEFFAIHDTCAFNYPHGSRQQWIGDSDLFLCNDRVGDLWGCRVVDAGVRKVIDTLPFPVHCHDSKTSEAYYVSYSRLRLVGGYGYSGLFDPFAEEDIPKKCGLYRGNIRTSEHELLVSLLDIASCAEIKPKETGFPHYVTHPVLNPAKTRIAFLHRYRVVDGGEITRLITVGVDGSRLRVLAKGFLSHFDWLDDTTIMIWGAHNTTISAFRELPFVGSRGVRKGVKLLKMAYRFLRPRRHGKAWKQPHSFIRITDEFPTKMIPQGLGVLEEDGHPMVCPANRAWMVNDTYPNKEGVRTLMVYNHRDNRRLDLGQFKMLDIKPNALTFDVDRAFIGIAPKILEEFPTAHHLFTRSGYHCDLHPRWRGDGEAVSFDSIHDGTRQIYIVNTKLGAL